MLTSIKNFVKRNRVNIAIGVGLASAAVLYARSKFSEAKDRISSDRIARENLKRRFEQNQEDCSFTVRELLPTAADAIMRDLPIERYSEELQQKKANKLARVRATSESSAADQSGSALQSRDDDLQSVQSFASESVVNSGGFAVDQGRKGKSRTQLWNDIKIGAFTRAFTLIYTLALLTILTRVQLNLLGRKNYLSSVVSLAERDDSPTISLVDNDSKKPAYGATDDEVNRQYLVFSWWFLHKGWRRVRERVEQVVKEVFGGYTPRDTITLKQLHTLTDQVRRKIEVDDGNKWITNYLLPTKEEEPIVFAESGYTQQPSSSAHPPTITTISAPLRKMLDETSDLLDSPIAAMVMHTMLNNGFAVLLGGRMPELAFRRTVPTIESAQGEVAVPSTMAMESQSDAETPATKLLSVLAVLTREAQTIGSTSTANEYLQAMEQAKELEGFSALVYSNFDNVETSSDRYI